MNELSAAFTLIAGLLLLALPRQLACIPLLLGAAYLGGGAALEIGPATFTAWRILVAIGIVRVLIRGERLANGLNTVDRLMLLWALCLMGTSALHTSNAWLYRAGLVWSELGGYLLLRMLVQDGEDVLRVFKILSVLLVPVSALMLLEKSSGENLFAALGGVSEVAVRDGHARARGPFAHAILAGTVGATCFPMTFILWRRHRVHALAGIFAASGIVFASTSSGPIIMILFIFLGLLLWRVRATLPTIRWLVLLLVIVLDLVMTDPVYFLIARIDIAGGSQGWYRAQLIRSSIEHLDEWWLAGTDYTRHWMATGIHANEVHTDITNHVLAAGVLGGLPLMLVLIMTLVAAFRAVGRALQQNEHAPLPQRFLIWTLGAILFGHLINFFSISLFDQSIVFFYLVLAAIGAVHTRTNPPGSVAVATPPPVVQTLRSAEGR